MFKLEIKTGNAAFRDENETDKHGDYILDRSAYEVKRILREVSNKLENGYDEGKVFDINGNCVGEWKYK